MISRPGEAGNSRPPEGGLFRSCGRTSRQGSQGRTVDAVFALASAEGRRGLYVDVTRPRENVTVAYGKDEVQDFGELLVRTQRDNGKVLVRDVLRDVGLRKEIELERGQEEKRLRSAALELEREQKIGRGPKIQRGPGRGPSR